ncbi:unnamed protein product [Trifolium pratense]|uniref:Uncharacterized protein n=1 Tax=Trifolium pratense TaxID=57577 RepID=A0ACB0JEC5_TRIPR|nr:unnamed protein product [Trifolium pratense]
MTLISIFLCILPQTKGTSPQKTTQTKAPKYGRPKSAKVEPYMQINNKQPTGDRSSSISVITSGLDQFSSKGGR